MPNDTVSSESVVSEYVLRVSFPRANIEDLGFFFDAQCAGPTKDHVIVYYHRQRLHAAPTYEVRSLPTVGLVGGKSGTSPPIPQRSSEPERIGAVLIVMFGVMFGLWGHFCSVVEHG